MADWIQRSREARQRLSGGRNRFAVEKAQLRASRTTLSSGLLQTSAGSSRLVNSVAAPSAQRARFLGLNVMRRGAATEGRPYRFWLRGPAT